MGFGALAKAHFPPPLGGGLERTEPVMLDSVRGHRGSVVTTRSCLTALRSRCVPGFGVEQAAYGVQTQSFPKGSLLDVCPSSSAPSTLGSEQELQMLPKSRLNTVSVSYCPVSQDFPGGNLNLLAGGSGKSELQGLPQ